MNKEDLRLKILELASKQTTSPTDTLARAKIYGQYVFGPAEELRPQTEGLKRIDPSKRTDNSKILG